jgi:hypothetical protein
MDPLFTDLSKLVSHSITPLAAWMPQSGEISSVSLCVSGSCVSGSSSLRLYKPGSTIPPGLKVDFDLRLLSLPAGAVKVLYKF